MREYDIVIPSCSKDSLTLAYAIEGVKRNAVGGRRVIVVSSVKMSDAAEWHDERLYHFSIEDVTNNLPPSARKRSGWYFQQLLKLYAPFVIPGLTSDVLVVDSDVVLLKPVSFHALLNDATVPLYAYAIGHYPPYFEHMSRLLAGLKAAHPAASGITHHMMFDSSVLSELSAKVEQQHGKPFWQAFLNTVDPVHGELSGASEYEIYFHYVFSNHPNAVGIRELKWSDVGSVKEIEEAALSGKWDFAACHSHARKTAV